MSEEQDRVMLEQAFTDARMATKGSNVSGGHIAATAATIYAARLIAQAIREALPASGSAKPDTSDPSQES